MVDIVEDSQSLTDFKRPSAKVIRRITKTQKAVVLTINGKAELAIQDAASYQRLLDMKEKYETQLAIEQALEDVREGRHRPVADVFAAVRAKLGLPER